MIQLESSPRNKVVYHTKCKINLSKVHVCEDLDVYFFHYIKLVIAHLRLCAYVEKLRFRLIIALLS